MRSGGLTPISQWEKLGPGRSWVARLARTPDPDIRQAHRPLRHVALLAVGTDVHREAQPGPGFPPSEHGPSGTVSALQYEPRCRRSQSALRSPISSHPRRDHARQAFSSDTMRSVRAREMKRWVELPVPCLLPCLLKKVSSFGTPEWMWRNCCLCPCLGFTSAPHSPSLTAQLGEEQCSLPWAQWACCQGL